MSAQPEKDPSSANSLSPDENMLLGAEWIDSVCNGAQASPIEIERSWDEEIAFRVEEVRAGKVKLVPWSEVVSKTRAKFG
jgi:Putative addiction module component